MKKFKVLVLVFVMVFATVASKSEIAFAALKYKSKIVFPSPVTISYVSDVNSVEYCKGETSDNNSWIDLYDQHRIWVEKSFDMSEIDSLDEYVDKLTDLMEVGELPDVIDLYPASLNIDEFVARGNIIDITDIVKKYASEQLLEYMYSDGGVAMQRLTVNGRIYGLPSLISDYDNSQMLFIRKDWLDRLGLLPPTTINALEEVMIAFEKEDFDGNGEDDTQGIAVNGEDIFSNVYGLSGLFQAFGALPAYAGLSDTRYTFLIKNGKIVWGGSLVNEMEEALTWLNRMYEQNILPASFLLNNYDTESEKIANGKCGMFFSTPTEAAYAIQNTVKNDVNAEFIALSIPDGTGKGLNIDFLTSELLGAWGIGSQCENPEAVIEMMNLAVSKLIYPESEEDSLKYCGDYVNYTGYTCSIFDIIPYNNNCKIYKSMCKMLQGEDVSYNEEYVSLAQKKAIYRNYSNYMDLKNRMYIDYSVFQNMNGYLSNIFYGPSVSVYAIVDRLVTENKYVYSAYNGAYTLQMKECYMPLKKLVSEDIVSIIKGIVPIEHYETTVAAWNEQGGSEIIKQIETMTDKAE